MNSCEEQSQLTQHALKQQSSGNSTDVAYAATASYTPGVSHGPGGIVHHSPKGQSSARDLSKIQCFGCKNYGHYASQCKNKFCNYCKSNGHVINDCKRRPQNRTPRAYHVNTADATTSSDSPSAPVMPSPPPASTTSQITPELVQQMIINAFSALGISGNHKSFSSIWFIDSGASNHMTSSTTHLSNLQPYKGTLQVHTADGQKLPITATGDITHPLPLTNVFLSPHLATNLVCWTTD